MPLPNHPIPKRLKWIGFSLALFLALLGTLVSAEGILSGEILIPAKNLHSKAHLDETPLIFLLCLAGWLSMAFYTAYMACHIYQRRTGPYRYRKYNSKPDHAETRPNKKPGI